MKDEYDFSTAERGRFFRPDAELVVPIYLDPDVASFVQTLAKRRNVELAAVVNDWLRQDIALMQDRTVTDPEPI